MSEPTEIEIFTEIDKAVKSDLTLGATSPSAVAEFRLIEFTITKTSKILQGLWQVFEKLLINRAAEVPTCNVPWWDREIRKFQFGHELLLDPDTLKYYYEIIDIDAQIVDRVAVSHGIGKGVIKAAKSGSVALDEPERDALLSYIQRIQPLGSNILLISQSGDVLKYNLKVYFDPIVPKSEVMANVDSAVASYLEELAFADGINGIFYSSKLVDKIQEVSGVVDVLVVSLTGTPSGATSETQFDRKYLPVAGHMVADPNSEIEYLTETN